MAADVTIDLKLITRSFEQGMNKVNNSVSKTNLAIGNMVGSLAADTLKSFASAATTAFSSIFNGAKELEQTTKLFATLTGSMLDAKKVVNELRTAAAQTPFEMKGLQAATTQLLTLNEVTSDNVIPTLLKLGDVAAVGANDIEGLSRVFVKVQSEGRVTAETLESLINQSPVLAQGMVEAAGVNGMGALRKAMSEGKISSDILNDAITKLTSEGGIAFQAMAGQSATLGGQISNLSDTFTNLAADIGVQLLPTFKDVISTFGEIIEANKEFIVNSAAAAFGLLADAALLAVNTVKSGIAIYQENSETIRTFAGSLAAATAALVLARVAIVAYATVSTLSFASVATAATAMWAAISLPAVAVAAVIAGIGAAAFLLADNWDTVVGHMQKIGARLTGVWENISDGVGIMVAYVDTLFADMALSFVNSLDSMGVPVGSLKEKLMAMREASIKAGEAARAHLAGEEARTAGSIKAIDELTAKKIAAAEVSEGLDAGEILAGLKKADTEKKLAEAKAQAEADAQALKLENKLSFDEAVLTQDSVFREEILARDTLDAEVEAMTKTQQLAFLKTHLGSVASMKLIAQAEELAARGKFDQANAILDQGIADAKTKSLDTAKKEKLKYLDDLQKADVKAKQDAKDLQTKHDAEAKAEADRQRKGELLAFTNMEDRKTAYAKQTQTERLTSLRTGLSAMEGFMKSGSKKQFEIGKSAAIAGAVIDTFKGASAAFTSLAGIPIVGPALGVTAAAAAIVAGNARVQGIKNQKFEQGGLVAGSSFTGDSVGINVNSSEMILNKSQQTELFNLAKGNGAGGKDVVAAINDLGVRISNMEITLVADDTEIARSTSRGVQDGIVIGESR